MNIINYTNISLSNRIIRILSAGLETKGLTVYVKFPQGKEKEYLGQFTTPPPTISVFIHQAEPQCYDHDDKPIEINNIHQYIAFVFLHELYHYATWKKNCRYNVKKEENFATLYAYKTLKKTGLKI